MHGDTLHLRDSRRSVVEVGKVAVLGDELSSAAYVNVVVELDVPGEAVVAEVVKLLKQKVIFQGTPFKLRSYI